MCTRVRARVYTTTEAVHVHRIVFRLVIFIVCQSKASRVNVSDFQMRAYN